MPNQTQAFLAPHWSVVVSQWLETWLGLPVHAWIDLQGDLAGKDCFSASLHSVQFKERVTKRQNLTRSEDTQPCPHFWEHHVSSSTPLPRLATWEACWMGRRLPMSFVQTDDSAEKGSTQAPRPKRIWGACLPSSYFLSHTRSCR